MHVRCILPRKRRMLRAYRPAAHFVHLFFLRPNVIPRGLNIHPRSQHPEHSQGSSLEIPLKRMVSLDSDRYLAWMKDAVTPLNCALEPDGISSDTRVVGKVLR
jgi:hypothetical protein